jgi:hypothetical protein
MRLGVSQTYFSLLENGRRPLSRPLARKAQQEFEVPATALPVASPSLVKTVPPDELAGALAALGYPGFTHLKRGRRMNPAELLLAALSAADMELRLAEALPWVAWKHADLNWDWLLTQARLRDLQNRVGFVVALAKTVADRRHDAEAVKALDRVEAALEPSRLAREDTLARESMTQAERRWLRTHRPPAAEHWNLLTGLTADHLSYAS